MKSFSIIGYPFKGFLAMIALALSVQVVFAQHPISNALARLLNTGDFREAKESISNYSIAELAALPDSVLFDYYYLKAAFEAMEMLNGSTEKLTIKL